MIISGAAGDISFRRLDADDLPFLIDIRNECRAYLHDNRLFSLPECREWFTIRCPEFWLILLGKTKIGYFRTSERSEETRSVMLGADLHKDWRGRGLGFLSWTSFLAEEFSIRNTELVKLEVLSTNPRAWALYSKLGFAEKVPRKMLLRNGRSLESIYMELTKEKWLAAK